MFRLLNKKAYTLIEILGVIIVLSILGLISIPVFTNILKGVRSDYYKNLEGTLEKAGGLFFQDNRVYKPKGLLQTTKVTAATLASKKYVSAITDYNGQACNGSYVLVIKKSSSDYEYVGCLKCSYDDYNSSNSYCDGNWDLNTNIDYEMQDPPTVSVYVGTSREKIRELLKLNTWVIKRDSVGDELARVDSRLDPDGKVPVIYPSNLDTVDINTVGNYMLSYEYEGVVKIGTLVIHRDYNAVYWTVSYDCNGISCFLGKTIVKQGSTYGTLPTPPERSGYVFDGWYTAATGGVKITSTSNVNLTSDTTLYAHWF